MDIYYIPFESNFIVYRPLRPLAFVGNLSLVDYIQRRLGGGSEVDLQADAILDAVNFWEPDNPAPEDWVPSAGHRPHNGVLLMTSACNLRCTYCYAHAGEGPLRQMQLPLARSVIDIVCRNALLDGSDHFSLTFHGGGEPTANWDVLRGAVDYALQKELPCVFTMATNGVLSEDKTEFVIRHFSEISLSFDGIERVHNSQRPTAGGSDSFGAVMRTIRAFDRSGFPYGVRMTVTPEHFATMAESVEYLCRETSCRGIQIEPSYSGQRGGHVEPDQPQSAAFVRAFADAFETACRFGRPLSYSGARPLVITASFCRAASHALVVTPEGNVVTCFEVHDETHPLSDAFTVGSIAATDASRRTADAAPVLLPIIGQDAPDLQMNHSALAAFVHDDHQRRASCRDCFCYWHCAGDCATRRSASTTATAGRCHVNREITKEQLAWYIAAGGGVWNGHNSASTAAPAQGDRALAPVFPGSQPSPAAMLLD